MLATHNLRKKLKYSFNSLEFDPLVNYNPLLSGYQVL